MQELCQNISRTLRLIILAMTPASVYASVPTAVPALLSAITYADTPERAASLTHDLTAAGLTVLPSAGELGQLAQQVQQQRPDVLVCSVIQAGDALFKLIRSVAEDASCAVLVLTDSLDGANLAAAVDAGVHCYVADGYSAHRLPALVQLAQTRFKHEAALTQALREARNQLDERKVVDHAKAILMRARDLTDDAAFRMLRTASMHSNQRLAEVSGHIIHAARFADGVNRAGQLRMLSQRLVKLKAMQLLRPDQAPTAALKDAVKRIDDNLTVLRQNFAQPDLAILVKQAATTWDELKRKIKRQPPIHLFIQDMASVDALAEALLANAEHLTGQLEDAGGTPPLQVLNLAGRQRMLSQRFAKYALLQALTNSSDAAAILEAKSSFEKAQHYLNNIPLNTPEIGQLLATAKLNWTRLLAGAGHTATATGQGEVESASEALLAVFEQLSATYESSMQMLMG